PRVLVSHRNSCSTRQVNVGRTSFCSGHDRAVRLLMLPPPALTLIPYTTLSRSGLLTWSGGTQSGSGSTSAQGGMALSGGTILDGRTLNTSQQVIWSGQNSRLDANNGAVINNAGSWDSQADQFLLVTAGAPAFFHNNG